MVDITNQMNTKVRLVRCPRCRLVLPELADVPVYECGGCGTILQGNRIFLSNYSIQHISDINGMSLSKEMAASKSPEV